MIFALHFNNTAPVYIDFYIAELQILISFNVPLLQAKNIYKLIMWFL